MSLKFITNEQLYKEVILPIVNAKGYVWIINADNKDLLINQNGTMKFS